VVFSARNFLFGLEQANLNTTSPSLKWANSSIIWCSSSV